MVAAKRRLTGALTALLVALALVAGCGRLGGQAIIDWADFLMLNGVSYTSSWNAVVTDPARIGSAIGKVKFNVADNVHRTGYKAKDGDAAFLAKGTEVYEVSGYPDHSLVAVKDKDGYNGYRLYVANGKFAELFASLEPDESKVKLARLYEGYTYEKLLTNTAMPFCWTASETGLWRKGRTVPCSISTSLPGKSASMT